MSKLSFTFLVALSSTVATLPEAQALQPKDDFFVHVLNSTRHPLEICNSELTFCKELLPGNSFSDAQATENRAVEYFGFWMYHSVVKVCEKKIPLVKLITVPVKDKDWRGKTTYRFAVAEENYLRECGTAAIKK